LPIGEAQEAGDDRKFKLEEENYQSLTCLPMAARKAVRLEPRLVSRTGSNSVADGA